jgi:hypothetical protein
MSNVTPIPVSHCVTMRKGLSLLLISYCLTPIQFFFQSNIVTLVRLNMCRKSQRRKSARLDSILPENTMGTSETVHEDVIAPLPSSSSNASMEQSTNQKQGDGCSSMKANEGPMAGRRSLRRAAEKGGLQGDTLEC